jgi:hypothetical protein
MIPYFLNNTNITIKVEVDPNLQVGGVGVIPLPPLSKQKTPV